MEKESTKVWIWQKEECRELWRCFLKDMCSNGDPYCNFQVWALLYWKIEVRMWSIFHFCTTLTHQIRCVTAQDIRLCNVWVMNVKWKGQRRPGASISLLLSKSTEGATRLNVPIRRTNCYQQYTFLYRKMHCRGIWDWTLVHLEKKPLLSNLKNSLYRTHFFSTCNSVAVSASCSSHSHRFCEYCAG